MAPGHGEDYPHKTTSMMAHSGSYPSASCVADHKSLLQRVWQHVKDSLLECQVIDDPSVKQYSQPLGDISCLQQEDTS